MAGALSSFRNYLGVAVVRFYGTVTNSGGIAAGGTTLDVSLLVGTGGSITTSYSAIFIDGPNTETCTVATGYSAGVVIISATSNAHPAGCFVLFQPTASIGATAYLPIKTPKIPDKYDQLYDTSVVGSMVGPRGVAQGLRSGEWSFDGSVYGDTIGYLLGGYFGCEDYTAGTSSTPNTHVFSTYNGANGQPPWYAIYVYDDVNTRLVVGRFSDFELKYDPKQLLSYTTKFLSCASGVVANAASGASFSTLQPLASWKAALTINGTFTRVPLTYDLTMVRTTSENIPTMNGIQDPFDNFVGWNDVKGKVAYVKSDDSILSDYLTGSLETLVLTLIQGSGSEQIQLIVQMTQANYDMIEPMLSGKAYNTEDGTFTAVANSTDANTAGGGISPIKITLENAIGNHTYLI